MKMLRGGASVVALSLSTGMVLAQVSATQGEMPQTEFHSPMVLEFPADKLRDFPIGQEWEVDGLDKFFCDDVSISRLKIARKLKTALELGLDTDEPHGTFTAEIRTYTRPSHDRLVEVTIDLMRGGEKLLTWTAKAINAEEGKFGSAKPESRVMTAREMERLIEGDKPLRLRLTIMVEEG